MSTHYSLPSDLTVSPRPVFCWSTTRCFTTTNGTSRGVGLFYGHRTKWRFCGEESFFRLQEIIPVFSFPIRPIPSLFISSQLRNRLFSRYFQAPGKVEKYFSFQKCRIGLPEFWLTRTINQGVRDTRGNCTEEVNYCCVILECGRNGWTRI